MKKKVKKKISRRNHIPVSNNNEYIHRNKHKKKCVIKVYMNKKFSLLF